jgi:hypothetical protein
VSTIPSIFFSQNVLNKVLAMKIALEELGYLNVYHFSEVFEHKSHPNLWISALKAKYDPNREKSKEFTAADWDNLLDGCSVSTNVLLLRLLVPLIDILP